MGGGESVCLSMSAYNVIWLRHRKRESDNKRIEGLDDMQEKHPELPEEESKVILYTTDDGRCR